MGLIPEAGGLLIDELATRPSGWHGRAFEESVIKVARGESNVGLRTDHFATDLRKADSDRHDEAAIIIIATHTR